MKKMKMKKKIFEEEKRKEQLLVCNYFRWFLLCAMSQSYFLMHLTSTRLIGGAAQSINEETNGTIEKVEQIRCLRTLIEASHQREMI